MRVGLWHRLGLIAIPRLILLEDLHFDLSDGLLKDFPERDPDSSNDIDLRRVSRILLEEAIYPAVSYQL